MKKSEKISKIKVHPNNPRLIKDVKFKKLVQSIKDFPEMLEKRPIIVNKDLVCLGGNMRLKAAREAGLKEIWIDIADWSEEKQKEFIIKDNSGFGEWDWDILANEWDQNKLNDWGLDLPPMFNEEIEVEEDDYTKPNDLNVDVVLGDLIQIGNHRLLCGDSTDIHQDAKLMPGEISHLSFTSPPYNAGKSEKLSNNTHTKDNKYNIYNDNQSQNDYLKMLIDFTTNTLQYSNYLICNIQSLAGN